METGLRIAMVVKELYPDVVRHRIRIHCAYDDPQGAWRVRLKKGRFVMTALLEPADVDRLLSGRPCLSLTVALQVAVDAIARLSHDAV